MIRFKDHPSLREDGADVSASDPTGAYLLIIGREAQVVIVGAMQGTPGAYRVALNRRRRRQYRLESASFLPLVAGRSRKKFEAAQDRGFVSLIFVEK
jgi:hypothetical protein